MWSRALDNRPKGKRTGGRLSLSAQPPPDP